MRQSGQDRLPHLAFNPPCLPREQRATSYRICYRTRQHEAVWIEARRVLAVARCHRPSSPPRSLHSCRGHQAQPRSDLSRLGSDAPQSLSPKILETRRCQLGIAHRVLDIFVTKIGLQGAGVVPVIREFVAASMPQHVRMRLKGELSHNPSPFNHARESSRAKRRAALGREHEWRLRLLLALEPPQGAQFVSEDRVVCTENLIQVDEMMESPKLTRWLRFYALCSRSWPRRLSRGADLKQRTRRSDISSLYCAVSGTSGCGSPTMIAGSLSNCIDGFRQS
jgi:hypothetical protein